VVRLIGEGKAKVEVKVEGRFGMSYLSLNLSLNLQKTLADFFSILPDGALSGRTC